jgi:hypothetical protein
MLPGEGVKAWSARCDCYKGHNSASGRCNVRNVTADHTDPKRPVLCERCRTECHINPEVNK